MADELGVTPSQVAIAWTMARARSIHPIVGARRLDQLVDNLGAADVALAGRGAGAARRGQRFAVGFPTDFIEETGPWVMGEANSRVDGRTA